LKDFIPVINDPNRSPKERLEALRAYRTQGEGTALRNGGGEVNNHIHTIYSFSPYTPSMAALRAWEAGLEAAGSVDHDSAEAAEEMIAACAELGIGGCSGFEVRVSFRKRRNGSKSPFADRKINNPDSEGLVYMTVQGIPSSVRSLVREFLEPIHRERNYRNRRMVQRINEILLSLDLRPLDFQIDVINQSKAAEGGSVTERHLLAAVGRRFVDRYGRGPSLTEFLSKTLGLSITPKQAALLADPQNPHYLYDLLALLKTDFMYRFFIQSDEAECVSVYQVVDFADTIGAIPAYAYLGDVGESPTGDKKAEKYEDDYLEELFDELTDIGYRAITYMPPRNTPAQLERVQRLCGERGFMEISGVDINSSRQSFNCPEVLHPQFRHLIDTTWALIAHERLASVDRNLALFSSGNPLSGLSLEKRLGVYARAGRRLDRFHPLESAQRIAHTIQRGDELL
jgi:hypothetical protein